MGESLIGFLLAKKRYKTYNDDTWYEDYDRDEVPDNPNKGGDAEDRIRSSDRCYRRGKFDLDFCPKTPNCKKVNDKKWLGKPKLCINRVPIPGDKENFYIAAMKCIPKWENCDKCMCGDNRGGGRNYCKLRDGNTPNDDRVDVDCDGSLKRIKFDGNKFKVKKK